MGNYAAGIDLNIEYEEEQAIDEEKAIEEEKPKSIKDDALPDATKTSGAKFEPPKKEKFKLFNPIVISNF